MSDRNLNRNFVEMILDQEPLPDESLYSEHRKQIDQRLKKAQRDEKSSRIITIIVWSGAICVVPVMAAIQWLPRETVRGAGLISDVLIPIVSVLMFACYVAAVPLLLLYVLRYRRALDRAREDARDGYLHELHEKVAKLTKALEDKAD